MTTTVERDTGRTVVVVLDRAHARFFDVTADGVAELASFHSPATRGGKFHSDRHGSPGSGEQAYHGRLQEELRRHLEGITQHLLSLGGWSPGDSLLIAGNETVVAALRHVLPPNLTDRLIGSSLLNPLEVTPAAVAREARAVAAAHRPAHEAQLVAALERGLGTGYATSGARETLRALARRQVRTLLVAAGTRGTGYRCSDSGRLVLSAADCYGEGEAALVPDLVGEAIAAARSQDAAVELIQEPELVGRIDGMSALLRFTISAPAT